MNALLRSIGLSPKLQRYGVFVSTHHLLSTQPERTQLILSQLFPEQNCDIMDSLRAGQMVMVREGSQEALKTFAARLYSQGFQVTLKPLD